jgi:hypothetical protein
MQPNMDPDTNPFAVLSLIVAPAILTNATSVLVMSTSNRLARSVDRARDLSKQLETTDDFSSLETQRRLRELTATEKRSSLLLRALRHYYAALSGFALAALLSLLGAVLVPLGISVILPILEVLAVLAGAAAVGTLVAGSVILVRETRIAVQVLSGRAATVRRRVQTLESFHQPSEPP